MHATAQSIADEGERQAIIAAVEELQKARGSSGYIQAYKDFIATVADHMTVFAPFMPVLAQMLSPR